MMSGKKTNVLWFLLLIYALTPAETHAQDTPLSDKYSGRRFIMIDPGHGGRDLGAVGPSGITEKNVTLALAKYLREALTGAYSVHLTHDGDYWLDIERRTALANHHRSDIFISLHTGGSFHHKARGIAVYSFGHGTIQALFQPQKGAALGTEEELRPWDHLQPLHADRSELLAKSIHRKLLTELDPIDRGVFKAPLSLLRGADMPAVLIEIGYVSHPAEEKDLGNPEVMSDFAEAIGEGIRQYFEQTSGCITGEGMIEEDVGTGRGAAW